MLRLDKTHDQNVQDTRRIKVEGNQHKFHFYRVLEKVVCYCLAILSGIFLIPTLAICGSVFIICGVVCPVLGLIKMLDPLLQLGIPYAENITVISGVEYPVIAFFLCAVVGIGLLGAGRVCWKLLLGYFKQVRKMKDIQIRSNKTVFNYRVSGAVIKNNKILLNRLKKDTFWTFVGGKVEFGESSERAIIREYYEETGAAIEVERLAAVVENFFVFNQKQWHELLFFYILKDEKCALDVFKGERTIRDNSAGIYRWFDLCELKNIQLQPECSQKIIENLSFQNIQHIVNANR